MKINSLNIIPKGKKCLADWEIQALIDKELDKVAELNAYTHIKQCSKCERRVSSRRASIKHVLKEIDFADQYLVANKPQAINGVTKTHKNRLALWGSVAATVLLTIGLFTYFFQTNNSIPIIAEDNCKWEDINEIGFHTQFVSPNRLYQMRVIEITKTDNSGNVSIKTLAKKCN